MSRSGPNIPEAQRSTVQVKLRLLPEIVGKLDLLCQGDRGRSDVMAELIEAAVKRTRRKDRK